MTEPTIEQLKAEVIRLREENMRLKHAIQQEMAQKHYLLSGGAYGEKPRVRVPTPPSNK